MPATDYILSMLDFKEVSITNIEKSDSEVHFRLNINRQESVYPHCKHKTSKIKDYYHQIIRDIAMLALKIFIHIRKPRYICPECNHHFYPSNSVVPR